MGVVRVMEDLILLTEISPEDSLEQMIATLNERTGRKIQRGIFVQPAIGEIWEIDPTRPRGEAGNTVFLGFLDREKATQVKFGFYYGSSAKLYIASQRTPYVFCSNQHIGEIIDYFTSTGANIELA